MTDEEIKELARSIILEACETANVPESMLKESEDGRIAFEIDISTPFAEGHIFYSPQPYIEMQFKAVESELTFENGLAKIHAETFCNDLHNVALLIIKMMIPDLKTSAGAIPYLAGELIRVFSKKGFFKKTDAQQRQQINELIDKINLGRKKGVYELAKEYYEDMSIPQFLFYEIYEAQKKEWQAASDFYKDIKKTHKALKLVKDEFPLLPEEFIKMLSLKHESAPAKIALKCTAWLLSSLLNVPDETASERTLKRYLQESKNQRKSVSDEDFKKAFDQWVALTELADDWENKVEQAISDSADSIFDFDPTKN